MYVYIYIYTYYVHALQAPFHTHEKPLQGMGHVQSLNHPDNGGTVANLIVSSQ